MRVRGGQRYPDQAKAKLCPSCKIRGCKGHYDRMGFNIPSPSCKARAKYNAIRAVNAAGR